MKVWEKREKEIKTRACARAGGLARGITWRRKPGNAALGSDAALPRGFNLLHSVQIHSKNLISIWAENILPSASDKFCNEVIVIYITITNIL